MGAAPVSQELAPPGTLDVVRRAVRSVVEQNPSLGKDPALRKRIAEKMVRLSMAAAELLAEDRRLTDEVAQRGPPRAKTPVAMAQDAGSQQGMSAVRETARTVRNLREAIDFPTYVTSLITGVFQAITRSNMAQLESFVDLLEGVSASSETFTAQNITGDSAVRWALSRFDMLTTRVTDDNRTLLVLRPDAELPDSEVLASTLEASEDEVSGIDEEDLNGTLLPLVRRKLGRTRQSLLATLVLMGMQRVVVDDGRLHASMDLRVDATSAAEQTERSQFDTRTSVSAQSTFGMGAWGASAGASTTIGYVHSDDRFTREEISAQAGMRSSVDMTFRTEQIPLDQMANQAAISRIRDNSRVPEASWTQAGNRLIGTERRTGAQGTLPTVPAPPAVAIPTPPPLPERRQDGSSSQAGRGTQQSMQQTSSSGTQQATQQTTGGTSQRPAA